MRTTLAGASVDLDRHVHLFALAARKAVDEERYSSDRVYALVKAMALDERRSGGGSVTGVLLLRQAAWPSISPRCVRAQIAAWVLFCKPGRRSSCSAIRTSFTLCSAARATT